MAAKTKTTTPKKRPSSKKLEAVTPEVVDRGPVVLDNEEIANLKNRFDGWQWAREETMRHGRMEAMCQESYLAYVQQLRLNHKLPPKFNVDFNTGVVDEEVGDDGNE